MTKDKDKDKDKNKNKETDLYVISHTETYNRYLLTISSAAFPAIGYLIAHKHGWPTGLEISLGLFGAAIILTMFTLLLIIDDPSPKDGKYSFIFYIDWFTFFLFSSALALTYLSLWAI